MTSRFSNTGHCSDSSNLGSFRYSHGTYQRAKSNIKAQIECWLLLLSSFPCLLSLLPFESSSKKLNFSSVTIGLHTRIMRKRNVFVTFYSWFCHFICSNTLLIIVLPISRLLKYWCLYWSWCSCPSRLLQLLWSNIRTNGFVIPRKWRWSGMFVLVNETYVLWIFGILVH